MDRLRYLPHLWAAIEMKKEKATRVGVIMGASAPSDASATVAIEMTHAFFLLVGRHLEL
jgi:hypothetical protein